MNPLFLEQFYQYKASQKIAIKCEDRSMTYQALYEQCLMLASKLRTLGIGMEATTPELYDIFEPKAAGRSPWVIIDAGRSVDAVIGMIATWMAGGAYVLVGLDTPAAYMEGIMEDTAAAVLLREGDLKHIEADCCFLPVFPGENEIACAVFTSGSTGKPKGAVLEHRVINEMLWWQTDYMKSGGWTATAAYAPFGFIAAIWELFFPLAHGLTLHILSENTRHDLLALEHYIETEHISYLFLPPGIAEIFTQTYRGNQLKYLRVAGGRLTSCGDFGGRYEILYSLGMAENGGSVTLNPISKAMSGDIPVGKAWGKTRIDLVGDAGEIAVSGPSLFRGYLSRRGETHSKLVKNPYTNEPGYERMYLSGDLARIDENGQFIHMGRSDWNIKIRDMKVNLMQVEGVLYECAGVTECCVTSQVAGGENVLIGWVAGQTNEKKLREALSQKLPEHMIPSVFVQLEKLPRNMNGKINRSALICVWEENKTDDLAGDQDYVKKAESMSRLEIKIAELFERVLGLPAHSVGADDDFLRLGGNSLKLMRLQVEIAQAFSRNIPYTVLFDGPAPRQIAAALERESGRDSGPIPAAIPMEAYPLSAPMYQMWLLWRTGQDQGRYTVSIQCRFTGKIDRDRVQVSVRELISRNAILRSRFEQRGEQVFQIIEDHAEILISEHPRDGFDLSVLPIFDVSIEENILTFTTHHIIADAIGQRALMEDFWTLYNGGLPPKSAEVHDITMWYSGRRAAHHEAFWHQMFADGVPLLTLPHDFARPDRLSAVATESIPLDEKEVLHMSEYAAARNATAFQLFMTAYAMLLSKLSGQDSVVIGAPLAGREHPDMARTIGMFVRSLPVKLYIGDKHFEEILSHVRDQLLTVWDNQDMSVERLTELIPVSRIPSRSPFYDVMINYVPLPQPLRDDEGLQPEMLPGIYRGALFDLVLDYRETPNGVLVELTYASELYRPETIRRWVDAFKNLILHQECGIDITCPAKPKRAGEKQHEMGVQELDLDGALPQMNTLLQIWKEVLKTEEVSPEDDFFQAGGTSLAAIRLEAALFEKGWLLSAADIFQNPTLYQMVALMIPAEEIDWEAES